MTLNIKFIFIIMFFLSVFFTISSSSWITIWMGMEMNLFTFIFISIIKKNTFTSEALMKYFIIQASGSMMFLFSLAMNFLYFEESSSPMMLVPPLALMMKSGLAPFHFWVPQVMKKFSFFSLFLFFSFQKLAPLLILFSSWFKFSTIIIVLNICIGALGGIPQSSLVKMLIFSSINNSGWLILTLHESYTLFIFYFLIYTFMSSLVLSEMNLFNIKWLIQLSSTPLSTKFNLIVNLLSLMGLPPLLGFMSKWMTMLKLFESMLFIVIVSIIFSLFTLLFYLKTLIILFAPPLSKKWSLLYIFNFKTLNFNILNFLSPLIFNFIV